MFVKILLFAIISLSCAQGFTLICEFGNEEWINLGIVFQCKVHGMQVTSRNSISEVVGSPFRPIREVKALDVQDQRCQFMPSDVQTFFPNIEGLQVANSELKELQNADMQQFPNLKQLFMSENELQSLENDVFEPCPNIEYVNLGHNNIMHMGTDILAPLKNLQYCNIAGNSCIDTKMESPNAIQQFSRDLEKQCPPTPEMLKREKERKIPESLRTTAQPTTTTVAPELEDLKEELKKLKNKIAEHDQKIDEIKSKENETPSPETSDASPMGRPQEQPTDQDGPPSPPEMTSSTPSPPNFNLMDILNIPTPNYQQYPMHPSQPQVPFQNNFPMPAPFPAPFPQNLQCGPFGCTFGNNPPQLNYPQSPYENPSQPSSNMLPSPNQLQSPYPYNSPSLPGMQNPGVPQIPNAKSEDSPAPKSPEPPGGPTECNQYGCPAVDQPMTPTSDYPENIPNLQTQTPAPFRPLDVESGLSGMLCSVN